MQAAVAESIVEATAVLHACNIICSASDHGVPNDFFVAVNYLHSHIEGGVRQGPLLQRMETLGFKVLSHAAREEARATGGATPRALARGMLLEINAKGTRTKFKMAEDQE